MKGYSNIQKCRSRGDAIQRAFIFVDASPLIRDGDRWARQLPVGFILVDPLDTDSISFHALRGMDVVINGGDKDRVNFIAQKVLDARPARIVTNDGYSMEIISCN